MLSLVEFVRQTPYFTIAHRGASGEAPENTLAAIRLAIEQRVAMVEFDVQITADESIVVFHDDDVQRTTNGNGPVRSMSTDQVQRLDAGSWFDHKFHNERIPSLDQVLDIVQGKAYINIEIKPRDHERFSDILVHHVVSTLDVRGLLPHALLSSFDHGLLAEIRKIRTNAHTCALNVPGDERLPSEVLFACHANAFGCSLHELNSKRAANCKEHGIPWGVYTVNTLHDQAHARSLGVNAVVTNFPSRLTEL